LPAGGKIARVDLCRDEAQLQGHETCRHSQIMAAVPFGGRPAPAIHTGTGPPTLHATALLMGPNMVLPSLKPSRCRSCTRLSGSREGSCSRNASTCAAGAGQHSWLMFAAWLMCLAAGHAPEASSLWDLACGTWPWQRSTPQTCAYSGTTCTVHLAWPPCQATRQPPAAPHLLQLNAYSCEDGKDGAARGTSDAAQLLQRARVPQRCHSTDVRDAARATATKHQVPAAAVRLGSQQA
jgi:hypothetical protein